ncbi:MAG: hypothetical protein RMJ19_12165, partial [Gemmatales bacterium]|nr:hypothetical protein [Gemmatales bacterium]MDW8176421.1 hypothetical protein [Gemmatales bacterium]
EFGLDPGELALLLARICERQGKDANMTRLPGQGGVTRGRADAELTFGKPSSAEGVQFQPEALKPGPLHNLNTPLVEVRKIKPGTERREQSPGSGLGQVQGVGEGYERQILPRHRATVRQYFESGR